MTEIATILFDSSLCDVTTQNGCQLQFFNINMKQVLGKMFDKYELFNIELVSIASLVSSFGNQGSDRSLYLTMSGFNYENSLYNIATKQKQDPIFAFFSYSTTTGVTLNATHNSSVTFRAVDIIPSITIRIMKFFNIFPNSGGVNYPQSFFQFIIYPVKDRIYKPLTIEENTKTKK